jgi:hypothetical protein
VRVLIAFLLLCDTAWAQEKQGKSLEFVFSPSGGKCQHVLIKEGGEVKDVTTIKELYEPVLKEDSVYVSSVKQTLATEKQVYDAKTFNATTTKTLLESKSYAISDSVSK